MSHRNKLFVGTSPYELFVIHRDTLSNRRPEDCLGGKKGPSLAKWTPRDLGVSEKNPRQRALFPRWIVSPQSFLGELSKVLGACKSLSSVKL